MTKRGERELRELAHGQEALCEALFAALERAGSDAPGITRDAYGPGENRAHEAMATFASDHGLEIGRDAAANLYMTLPGRDRDLPRIIVGSHLDSVPHGGNFDGAAGVVAGLSALVLLQDIGHRPERDLTVMAIRAEESGVWFRVSYPGSRGALGILPDGALEAIRLDTGRTLAEHVAACGGDPERLRRREALLPPASIHAYLETHIEQAPSLHDAGLPVAICTGIPGLVRFPEARILGEDAHPGLPRRFRRDAAMAGAEMAMALDRRWAACEERGCSMAFTLGRFHTDHATHAMTVVPGRFDFSIDLRAHDPDELVALEADFRAIVAEIERRRGVRFELGVRRSAEVGRVDPVLSDALERAAHRVGVPTMRLGSPASHDAAAFAEAGVPIAMLLVRNDHGSHNPAEAMALEDLLDAVAILIGWLEEFSD